LKKISNIPPAPPNRLIYEFDDGAGNCPKCASSLKRKWIFFKTKHCIQPQCENYFGNK